MKKGNLILRIIALVIAAGMISFILYMANGFVGNPITAALADKAIKEYAAKNYPSMNLDIGKVHYNFKFSSYSAKAKSNTSIDTHFSIYYKGGKVQRDDYESYVLGYFNTLTRLEDEYSKQVIPIISSVEGLESNRSMVMFDKQAYEKAKNSVTLDMKFDKNLPFDMKITIRADLTDISLKNITRSLEASHKALIANGCKLSSYDIFSEYNGVLVMISEVTPSDIESGELEQRLIIAQKQEEIEQNKDTKKDNVDKDNLRNEAVNEEKQIRVYIKKTKDN